MDMRGRRAPWRTAALLASGFVQPAQNAALGPRLPAGTLLAQGFQFLFEPSKFANPCDHMPDVLVGIARQAGVDPRQVVLEITESRLMNDLATSLEVITRLRLRGFGLSIDDFGTGYSSMERLKQMPFTELKVDRAFVHGAADAPVARAILESSVSLGHALGMQVVAEGAETLADLDMVAAVGCDEVQGYVVAKPMPAGELIDWKTGWEEDCMDQYELRTR